MTQELWIYYGFLYLISFESLQIRYAYELLTNPLWKRDYDLFGIDEQLVSTFDCILQNLSVLYNLFRTCVSCP